MIQSMTGFASKNFILTTKNGKKATVSLNLKTLNSKFFEVNCKLPSVLTHLETALFTIFKNKLYRGHIYFSLYLSNQDIFQGNIEAAYNTIDAYIHILNSIKEKYSIASSISLDHIIRLPNIFNSEEQQIDESTLAMLQEQISLLIEQVVEGRQKEGATLLQDLLERVKNIESNLHIIKEQSLHVIEKYKQKVQQTLSELTNDSSQFAEMHKNSVFALLDKIDIHEELTRFSSHINNFVATLHNNTIEKGKKLDFILQELIRETNTINAKCSDTLISTHAINIKVELEKLREQIQNIV